MRFVEVISHPQPCPITEPAIGQPLLGIVKPFSTAYIIEGSCSSTKPPQQRSIALDKMLARPFLSSVSITNLNSS